MATTNSKVEIDWRATLVEALNSPGSLGNTYNRFYNYSFLNQIRLLMQGVHEPVATYNRWAELGFQVQKGCKAKVVLAPIMINKVEEKDGKPVMKNGKPQKRQVLIGFRESRTVFGFSDTDGDELPPINLPAWNIEIALESLNVERKRFRTVDGNTQGYSEEVKGKKQIAINPAAKYPAKTLFHELAHLVLGHCKHDGAQMHRGVLEFEAEATAYLIAKELEMVDWNPSESRAYIDGWLKNGVEIEDLEKHIGRIFSAANKILTAGRKSKLEESAA